MNNSFLTFLLVLVIPVLGYTQSSDWQIYKDSVQGFRAVFPKCELKFYSDSSKTAIGPMVTHKILAQNPNEEGPTLFILSYNTFPEGMLAVDSPLFLEDFFKETLDAAVQSVDGELIYQEDIQYEEYPGKVWKISYNKGNAVLHTKAYIVDDTYYYLQTASLTPYALHPSVLKFFENFRLLE